MQYLPAWLSGSARVLQLACVLAVVSSLPGVASAQDSNKDELARSHFESGAAYLQQSDLDSALREFENAYRLSPRPEILLNIATVHERTGDLPAAVSALERYLESAPEGKHAGTVQVRIENLNKRIDEGSQKPEAEPAPAAPQSEAVAPAPPKPAPTPVEPAPAAEQSPVTNRLPAYLLLGGAGVAAIAATVTGLLANSEYEDLANTCKPNCTDSEVSKSKNLALTSTVLTAVGVVAAGVGVALLFTASPEPARDTGAVPRVAFEFDTEAVEASASWRF
jgi:tetratricopeptide (TPR) repeat protein